MINFHRPKPLAANAKAAAPEKRPAITEDSSLPQIMMRLPNLNELAAPQSTWALIGSISHWIGLFIGAMLALWLIFGDRKQPLPNVQDVPQFRQPVRADASGSTPAWVPPPLESAGNSEAPAWTPPESEAVDASKPKSEAASAPTATQATAPTSDEQSPGAPGASSDNASQQASPALTASSPGQPNNTSPADPETAEPPSYESWPKTEPAPAYSPEQTPAYSPEQTPAASSLGEPLQTARREVYTQPESHSDDIQTLGITVAVPQ